VLDPARLDQEVEEARDDRALLDLLASRISEVEAYLRALRSARTEAAKRLHDLGVPMSTIARAARVTDSYLARQVYDAGGIRRIDR
jgi:lipid A disaccharide synthetase